MVSAYFAPQFWNDSHRRLSCTPRERVIIHTMYLDDGERYPGTYARIPDGIRAIAIGWLDAERPYDVGVVAPQFTARLSTHAGRMRLLARVAGTDVRSAVVPPPKECRAR